MTISDDTFLVQFEKQTLNPKFFDHHGHLRLAWLYLQRYSLAQTIEKVTQGLSAFATSHGATDKFQYTLTEAIVRIMAERMQRQPTSTLESFLAANQDLVDDIWGLVGTHYSEERLNSEQARREFVTPDLAPLSGV